MKHPVLVVVGVLAACASAMAGYQVWNWSIHRTDSAVRPEHDFSESRSRVTLNDAKFSAARVEVAAIGRHELQSQKIVPGRIEYNATRHVQIKSPFDGLVRSVAVKVGDQVNQGQLLAVVDSPELGERRADVLLRKSEHQQTVNEHEWWHSIQANVDELVGRLKRPQELAGLEKEFAEKILGGYRQQIMSAYSRMRLAEKVSKIVKSAGEGVSERSVQEQGAARETTAAEFIAVCEQATFDVKQKHLKAESVMDDAERRLAVAHQRLDLLTGHQDTAASKVGSTESLSTWPVLAPFQGTVEQILLPPNERVQLAEGLFQLADVSRLWVQADIRERDWSALTLTAGQLVSVQSHALPGKDLQAKVAFVGRAVAFDTRAVPVTADIDNSSGLLRPGMFVRVLIPDGPPRGCLAVPQAAIATHDGKAFVFIETRPREFQRKDVTTGISVDSWVEIIKGLALGERIAISGVSILKAELLLEAEE